MSKDEKQFEIRQNGYLMALFNNQSQNEKLPHFPIDMFGFIFLLHAGAVNNVSYIPEKLI